KWGFGRTRPFRGYPPFDWHPFPGDPRDAFHVPNLSFPSGDTTLAFATAAIIAIAFPKWRWVAYGWAFAVGIARVLQGAHYPSDVAGGIVVGVGMAHLLYWICARCRKSAR
ncbi:MAG TPA: phosphatase PAP2 family protein, partial [Tepidisphaeraceae bacterium]|nr:phosphatase PAP2 family protein [Tepidisphaeraceae bacterium]